LMKELFGVGGRRMARKLRSEKSDRPSSNSKNKLYDGEYSIFKFTLIN